MYEELKDNNFEIIAVAEDTGGEAAAGEWYDRAEATYTTLIDTTHKISSLYNLVNVPSAVWVDEDGQIVRINEGTYAQVHTLGTFEFGTDEYAPAVRDWAIRGADSPYVWTADEVAAKIRPRTADEARAESTFKLGVYFFEQGDEPLARIFWERAEALHPDSWNYHRQDWSFTDDGSSGVKFGEKRANLGDTPYYAPLDLPDTPATPQR